MRVPSITYITAQSALNISTTCEDITTARDGQIQELQGQGGGAEGALLGAAGHMLGLSEVLHFVS